MELSYNGWPASPNPAEFGGLEKLVVAGEEFAPGVRAGDVRVVLQYVFDQMHARVEPVVRSDWHQADDWGFSYRTNRNANNLSCHASGTAGDYNATRHPNGKRGTYLPGQVTEIRKILAEVNGVVRWGGDFTGTADEMHFEICRPPVEVKRVADRLRGKEQDMPLTPEDIKKVAQEVLGTPVRNMNGDMVSVVQILNGVEDKLKKLVDKEGLR